MKNTISSLTTYRIIFVLFVFAGLGGWIANIVKLISMIDGEITAMFVARAVGIFAAPLGAILGYL